MLFVHRQNDLEGFRVAKLHHDLSAHAAGSCIFCEHASLTADNTDSLKILHPFAYCLKKGGTLAQFVAVYPAFSMLQPV